MKTTILGKIIGVLLILGIVAGGLYYAYLRPGAGGAGGGVVAGGGAAAGGGGAARGAVKFEEVTEGLPTPAKLDAPGEYVVKDNTVAIELSEYAGYAGIIAANGGLAPSESSLFFQKYGFKVKLTVSEAESWGPLNAGKMAASATTTDVLAAYGKQFQVVVPVQIGFSRGADALVVRSEISRINDLKGKVVATCEFTESDFLIRYLAQEAGIGVTMLPDLNAKVDADAINVVFTADGFKAGDLLAKDLQKGTNLVAGAMTWSPKTEEIVEGSGSKLKILTTNRNLLVVADILVVNKAFAEKNPKMVAGLVAGVLEGNRLVNNSPSGQYDVIEKAFKWEKGKAKRELAKVHLSNLPENLAFFSGEIDSAGSFNGIFQSAVLAYGSGIIPDPMNPEKFVDVQNLKALQAGGAFGDERVSIAPIKMSAGSAVERNPLLSKNIRFLFNPNSSDLDMTSVMNGQQLESIKKLLQVSPGSLVLLRGHVDDGQKAEFAKGGESRLRDGALRAMKLSTDRANEIKRLMIERGVAKERIDTVGRGWEEPLGTNHDENRRVEVQWFTVE